jgi:hypothetical protein
MRGMLVARASCKCGLATPRAVRWPRVLGLRGAGVDVSPGPEPAARE